MKKEKEENIQEICNYLLALLNVTKAGKEIGELEYSGIKNDIVILYKIGKCKRMETSGKSGIEIIKEILNIITE